MIKFNSILKSKFVIVFLTSLFVSFILFINKNLIFYNNSYYYDYDIVISKKENLDSFLNLKITDSSLKYDNTKFFAWIPHFDFENSFQGFLNNKNNISEVHYAGVSIDQNGNLFFASNFYTSLQALNENSDNFGINIHSSSILGLKRFLNKNISDFLNFINLIKKNYPNFSSINLNFEKLDSNDKNLIINFIKNLSLEFNNSGINLYLTIFAPSINSNNSNLTLDILGEDFFSLFDFLDYIVIMFYDFSLNRNGKYGLSPLFWLNNYLKTLQQKQINFSKLIVALPFYGYEYNKNGDIVRSLVYDQIKKLISNNDNILKDNDLDESYIILPNNGNIIYFLSSDDIIKRINLAKKYGINKFFFWRLTNSKYIEGKILDLNHNHSTKNN